MTESIDPNHREGMAYLLAYMSDDDLASMDCSLYKGEHRNMPTRHATGTHGAATFPDGIFFNEVLPYCVADEKRMSWRPQLFELTSDITDPSSDLRTAADSLCSRLKT